MSNLLYLFVISGLLRGVLAALLSRRVRELRKPRRSLSAPALVMRVTGLNSMVGFVYDFIGRPAPELEERAPALEKRDNDAAPAKPARNRDE